MNTLAELSAAAIARYDERSRNNGNAMLATFFWNGCRYQVEVMGHEVAFLRTLPEVRAFCAMHNREF